MDEDARSARGYRARAVQLRVEAHGMTRPETAKALLNLAGNYEQLAHRVENSRNSS